MKYSGENTLNPPIKYSDLPLSTQHEVCRCLIRNNRLKISTEQLHKYILDNFLVLRFDSNGLFCCVGLKTASISLRIKLITLKEVLLNRTFHKDRVSDFISRINSGRLMELGWALNLTSIPRARLTLEGCVDEWLDSQGLTRQDTFSLVNVSNNKGYNSAIRAGYVPVFQFTYKDARLYLNLWKEESECEEYDV